MNDPTLAALVADLDRLADEIRWAHTHGHWPTGRALDAVRGASLPPPDPDAPRGDPDHVKAPRYDIGIGDHHARHAYQQAATLLAFADVELAAALDRVGRRQPPVVKPTARSSDVLARITITACRWRAEQLDRILPGQPTAARAAAARHVKRARKALFDAVDEVVAALGQGDAEGIAHAEELCVLCELRPRAERRTRCDTCQTWWQRNGFERPRNLDDDVRKGAREAAARRRERGESYGAEDLSCTTTPPIVAERAPWAPRPDTTPVHGRPPRKKNGRRDWSGWFDRRRT